jgi:hypothetical protein
MHQVRTEQKSRATGLNHPRTLPTMTALPWGSTLTVADLEHLPDDGHRYEHVDGPPLVPPEPNTRRQSCLTQLALVRLTAACPGITVLVTPARLSGRVEQPLPAQFARRFRARARQVAGHHRPSLRSSAATSSARCRAARATAHNQLTTNAGSPSGTRSSSYASAVSPRAESSTAGRSAPRPRPPTMDPFTIDLDHTVLAPGHGRSAACNTRSRHSAKALSPPDIHSSPRPVH